MIISRVIDLELKINEFLAIYFKIPEERLVYFHDFVLENKYNPVVSKRNVLGKILKRHNLKKDNRFKNILAKIQDIFEHRNILAHCKIGPNNTLISMGEEKSYSRKDIYKILDMIDTASEQLDVLIGEFMKN